MPSWVVPTVAAEYWGVSVEQVMSDVAAGRVPSRSEGGFLFVDVDPAREVPAAPVVTRPAYRRPLTWSRAALAPTASPIAPEPLITAAERDALLAGADDLDPPARVENEPTPLVLTEDDIPNCDEVRARVARTRRAPTSNAA